MPIVIDQCGVRHLVPKDKPKSAKRLPTKADLYRWWLYRGPGRKAYRQSVREKGGILPPGFEITNTLDYIGFKEGEDPVRDLRESYKGELDRVPRYPETPEEKAEYFHTSGPGK
jgi:hypothetical protein